jgi:GNAT superfamily N-acetyltransferase
MELTIRAPRESEFPAVRAMLPETANDALSREFRLVFETAETGTSAIAGALSYTDQGEKLTGLRVHVVQNRRRRGIGRRMVESVVERARELGRQAIAAEADIKNEPAVEPFLAACGFHITNTLTCVETDVEKLQNRPRPSTPRLDGTQEFPEGSRIVGLDEAPLDQILEMHGRYIANAPMAPGLLRSFRPEEFPDSVVLMMGDQVIAFVLAQVKNKIFYVPAWCNLPEYRGKRIGLLLFRPMEERMRQRYKPGDVTHVRFEYADAATYTAKLAIEAGQTIVRIVARFERALGPTGL